MKQLVHILLPILLGISCTPTNESDPKFIIEAYLFAGEKVQDIRIKEQIGIDQPDSLEVLITDATVVLIKENEEYLLAYEAGLYKYLGNDLRVETGDVFRLEVHVGNRMAYAETTVPPPTEGLSISSAQLVVPEIVLSYDLQEKLMELFFTARIAARWDNPDDKLHFVVVEPVVNEFDSIFPSGFPPEAIEFLSGFKYAPETTATDTFSIIGIAFESYGRHRAKVYRVNQEYADLFNNPEQDSRDLTVPPSNIVNGFGIFSAFSADSVFFEIVRE